MMIMIQQQQVPVTGVYDKVHSSTSSTDDTYANALE